MPRLKGLVKAGLAFVAGLIVLLVIAVAVAVLVIDPDAYRPLVQRKVSATLGRDITIDRLAIARSFYPTIAVADLRIANPDWASRPNLVSISSAAVRLDLVALVYGEIEIGSIEVEGVDLLLERDVNGVGNWVFSAGAPSSGGSGAGQLPGLDAVSIRNAKIGWRGDDGTVTDVRIESADAMLPADGPVQIEATVVYRQVAIDATLTTSTSLGDALSGQPVAASIGLRALDARANLEVALPNLRDIGDLSSSFAVNGQQLDALSALVDQPLPAWGPYRVSGGATLAAGSVRLDRLSMFIEGLSGKTPLALSRIEIDSGTVTMGQDVPTSVRLAGNLDETGFSLDLTTAELARLSTSAGNIPVTCRVTLDDFELGAEGTIHRAEDSWAFELASNVKGDVGKPLRLVGATQFKRALLVDLSGRVEGDANRIAASGLRGSVAQTSVSGNLTLRPGTPFSVNAEMVIGTLDLADFEITGEEGRPAAQQQRQSGPPEWTKAVDADLRLRVERIVGLPVAAADISGRAILKGGQLELRKFRGKLADTLILADGGLRWRGSQPQVNASVTMPVVDIEKLTGKGGAANKKKDKRKDGKDKVLDAPLPVALLRLVDADLDVNIGRLDGAGVAVNSLRGSAQLNHGRLRVPSLSANLAGIAIRSTLALDSSRDGAHLSANVSALSIDIARLTDELKVDAPVTGSVGQAAVTLETRGASLRNWIGNAKVIARVGASALRQIDGDDELTIEQANAVAGPGLNVRAEMRGQYGEFPVDLVATGGRLKELLDEEPLWPKLAVELKTAFRGMPIRLSAQSALHALLSGRDVPVRAEMRSPHGFAVVAGTIADLREPTRTPLDVKVSVKGEVFKPLIRGEWLLPDLPIKASAKASLDEGVVSLRRLRFRAGEADLSGEIRLELKDRIRLTANLSGELLDLRPWLPAPAQRNPSSTGAASLEDRASKLDQAFDVKGIREFDAALQIKLRRLISHRFDLDSPTLKANLDSGRLDATASIAEGGVAVGLTFDGSRDSPTVAIRAGMTNLNLDTLKTDDARNTVSNVPIFSASLRLDGTGATPREVYQSAKGEILVAVGPGQLRKSSKPFTVQAVSTDLVRILMPGRKPDGYTQMECAALYLNIADGVASSPRGIAIRLKDVDIIGSGAINLVTTEILFGFKAVRRRWLSFSFLDLVGNLATIGGTLDNPRVGLDPGGTLVTGGAAWATVGLSLLATRFWRQLRAAGNPCDSIIEKRRAPK